MHNLLIEFLLLLFLITPGARGQLGIVPLENLVRVLSSPNIGGFGALNQELAHGAISLQQPFPFVPAGVVPAAEILSGLPPLPPRSSSSDASMGFRFRSSSSPTPPPHRHTMSMLMLPTMKPLPLVNLFEINPIPELPPQPEEKYEAVLAAETARNQIYGARIAESNDSRILLRNLPTGRIQEDKQVYDEDDDDETTTDEDEEDANEEESDEDEEKVEQMKAKATENNWATLRRNPEMNRGTSEMNKRQLPEMNKRQLPGASSHFARLRSPLLHSSSDEDEQEPNARLPNGQTILRNSMHKMVPTRQSPVVISTLPPIVSARVTHSSHRPRILSWTLAPSSSSPSTPSPVNGVHPFHFPGYISSSSTTSSPSTPSPVNGVHPFHFPGYIPHHHFSYPIPQPQMSTVTPPMMFHFPHLFTIPPLFVPHHHHHFLAQQAAPTYKAPGSPSYQSHNGNSRTSQSFKPIFTSPSEQLFPVYWPTEGTGLLTNIFDVAGARRRQVHLRRRRRRKSV